MHRRPYRGVGDLTVMQRMVAERTRAMGIGSNLHTGDIPHHIYSGLRREDPASVVPVWEDADRRTF